MNKNEDNHWINEENLSGNYWREQVNAKVKWKTAVNCSLSGQLEQLPAQLNVGTIAWIGEGEALMSKLCHDVFSAWKVPTESERGRENSTLNTAVELTVWASPELHCYLHGPLATTRLGNKTKYKKASLQACFQVCCTHEGRNLSWRKDWP